LAVSATTFQELIPFRTPATGDPYAELIGRSTASGDATGGAVTFSWSLTLGAVALVRAISIRHTSGVVAAAAYRIATGYVLNGTEEIYGHNELISAVVGDTGATWRPPPIFCRPRNQAIRVEVDMPNVDTIVFQATFRALIFQEYMLRDVPPSALGSWLSA